MSASETRPSGHERDAADLARFGYKQELKRGLGLFSSFAVAFSYISPSTGIFTLFALGLVTLGGVFIWTWPVVALGQFIIALNFAEISSHYPVAGSVFQWTKYLANRSYSWMTGWVYLFAGIITVAAVVATLPLALIPALNGLGWHSLNAASLHTQLVVALITLVVITVLNIYGVRLVAIINNTGVVFEILGMFVFALILMAFHNHQGFHVVTNSAGFHVNGSTFLAAMFMGLFVIYGFDTASTLAEETRDPRRNAPKAVLFSVIGAFIIGGVFLLGALVAIPSLGPDFLLLPPDPGRDDPARLRHGARQPVAVLQAAGQGVAQPAHPGLDLHRGRAGLRHPVHQVRGRRDHRDRGHRDDLPELLPRHPGDPAGARPRLAQGQRAVLARPLGHAGQHPRADLRRGDADQLRLAAGGEQPQAQPDRRAAEPRAPLPQRHPDPVECGGLHRADRRHLLPDRRADQGLRPGHGAFAGRRPAGRGRPWRSAGG